MLRGAFNFDHPPRVQKAGAYGRGYPLLNLLGAIIMRSVTAKFWNSTLKLIGLLDRAINTADAIMETAENAATRFRDEEQEAAIKALNLRV